MAAPRAALTGGLAAAACGTIHLIGGIAVSVRESEEKGARFHKAVYRGQALPEWVQVRLQLPRPDWPPDAAAERAYWLAWETAVAQLRRPAADGRLVSNYVDPCLGGTLRLADAAWTTMFTTLAHGLVPSAEALDNFYRCQHPDGEICQEIGADGEDHPAWVNREGLPLFTRRSGRAVPLDRPAPVPALTLDGLNHPLAAWAELCHFRQAADAERLLEVWEPLLAQYDAMRTHLRHANGLYVANWASLENSPRNAGLLCGVDISAEMVLTARSLVELAGAVAREFDRQGEPRPGLAVRRRAAELAADADALSARIRQAMWDEESGFFYDLRADGSRHPVPTIAAFWTLVAGVATPEQAARLADWLEDPRGFCAPAGPTTLAVGAEGFDPQGGYYRGAVWPALVLMVTRGLRRYGFHDLAHALACRHLAAVGRVADATGAIWENYAPDGTTPGRPARPGFVGQSGTLLTLFLESILGLEANAPMRRLDWRIHTLSYLACHQYRVGGTRVRVLAPHRAEFEHPLHVSVESDQPLQIVVHYRDRSRSERIAGPRDLVL